MAQHDSDEAFLRRQAESLVDAARTAAISTYTVFAPRLTLHEIRMHDWEFFLTVANVFIAVSTLVQSDVGAALQSSLMDVVTANAADWNPDSVRACDDCKRMFEPTYDRLAAMESYRKNRHLVAADAIGVWIARNLLRRAPETNDEWQLARITGMAVTHDFAHWWDRP